MTVTGELRVGDVLYRQESRRCSKSSCSRCRQGHGHGPYWYAFWHDSDHRPRRTYCGRIPPTQRFLQIEGDVGVWRPALHIRLLGEFAVQRGSTLLGRRDWRRADARRLLALLLLHPRGMLREQAAEALWPDADVSRSVSALKTALSVLREVLEPLEARSDASPPRSFRLPQGDKLLRLGTVSVDSVDVSAYTTTTPPARFTMQELTDVVALYQGELLPEYQYEEWTAAPRERLRGRWQALALHLAQRLADSGAPLGAVPYLEAILADDGTQEEAARLLMSVLARQGHRDRALRVYRDVHASLEGELGVAPESMSASLADALRRENAIIDAVPVPARAVAEKVQERIQKLQMKSPTPSSARTLARLWAERGLALETAGDAEEALVSVESGRAALEGLDLPSGMSRLALVEATIYSHRGQAERAEQAAIEAGQYAWLAGERALEASALRLQAQAAQHLGRLDDAISLARTSTALFDALGDPEQSLRSYRQLAQTVWAAGRFAEAESVHLRNLERARVLGRADQLAYVLCGLGSSIWPQGDLDRAETCLLEAAALGARLDDHFLIMSAEYHLANLWSERARWRRYHAESTASSARDEATARFEQVLTLAASQGSEEMRFFAAADLSVLQSHMGDLDRAAAAFAQAQHSLGALRHNPAAHAWALLSQAELELARDNVTTAIDYGEQALTLLPAASPAGLAQVHRVLASAFTRERQMGRAERHWEESLMAAEQCGQTLEWEHTKQRRSAISR